MTRTYPVTRGKREKCGQAKDGIDSRSRLRLRNLESKRFSTFPVKFSRKSIYGHRIIDKWRTTDASATTAKKLRAVPARLSVVDLSPDRYLINVQIAIRESVEMRQIWSIHFSHSFTVSGSGTTRTCDRRLRTPLLYPTELQTRFLFPI